MTQNKYAEVLCNWCGHPCNLGPWNIPHGLVNVEVRGGFSSTPGNGFGALDDSNGYHFSLCEFCLDYLFGQFKIHVAVTTLEGEREPWIPASVRVDRDEWRKSKTRFHMEKDQRDSDRTT